LDWARGHLPNSISDLLQSLSFDLVPDGFEIAQLLIQHHIAESATHCEMIAFYLLAHSASVEDLVQNKSDDLDRVAAWCFDLATLPKEYQRQLEQGTDKELSQIQNWELAEGHARAITTLKPQLAWGWDLIGYAAERRGELESAKSAYLRGAECSVFSDQSVRLKTHWMSDRSLKFSVARLAELDPELVQQDPYLSLLCNLKSDPNTSVTQYWMQRATQFHDQGEFEKAVHCFMAAGWDVGAGPMPVYSELLDHIADSAQKCGQHGRETLARLHRRCLQDRYGI
jgi:tetratricopeptide (TPR) repeat protein